MVEQKDKASEIGQRMNALAQLAKLEAGGDHTDSLIKDLDPTKNKVIASKLGQLNPAHRAPNVLFSTMTALQRRKSRINRFRLLRHR